MDGIAKTETTLKHVSFNAEAGDDKVEDDTSVTSDSTKLCPFVFGGTVAAQRFSFICDFLMPI